MACNTVFFFQFSKTQKRREREREREREKEREEKKEKEKRIYQHKVIKFYFAKNIKEIKCKYKKYIKKNTKNK